MPAGAETPLRGAVLLVTRPAGQELELCRLIESAGGRALHFPTVIVVAAGDAARIRARLAAALPADVVIFISRNAVNFAFDAWPELGARVSPADVYAAGEGTAAVLARRGSPARSNAPVKAGSEGLLALPEFAPERIRGSSVVIVRGEGGREFLSAELARRGASPRYVEVYRRERPAVDAGRIKILWQEDRPDVIVITSIQGLDNLLLMTPATYHSPLLATRLAVISRRVHDHARELGFHGAIAVAAAAEDGALVNAAAQVLDGKT